MLRKDEKMDSVLDEKQSISKKQTEMSQWKRTALAGAFQRGVRIGPKSPKNTQPPLTVKAEEKIPPERVVTQASQSTFFQVRPLGAVGFTVGAITGLVTTGGLAAVAVGGLWGLAGGTTVEVMAEQCCKSRKP